MAGLARTSGGFALMAALMAVILVSLAAVVAVTRARFEAQREKELQLLWVGNQYRQALRSYQSALPQGGRAQYPLKLDDLLEDNRFPNPLHHLRRIYADPFTGKADWVLERQGDRIVGVHSTSTDAPVRHADLGPGNEALAQGKTYADWHFLATDPVAVASIGVPQASASPDGSANPPSNDNPATDTPAPPPDPVAESRAQCYAKYGTPSITCRGPNFAMGSNGPSCRQDMAAALDQCLAAAGN
jgi:type II secretory pathway pseudopilin PulG